MAESLTCRPAASLLGCPEEIRLMIVAAVPRFDLAALCLACRQLRALAEPSLYSRIHFYTWEENHPHPITSLLRSILHRPQLASYIHSVSLVGKSFYMPHLRGRAPKIPIDALDLAECLAFVIRAGFPDQVAWTRELFNGSIDAIVAVLLAQPLRLRHLFLGSDYFKESQLIGFVLRSTILESHNKARLSNLATVTLQRLQDRQRDQNVRNTADVLPLFYLPSIKSLSISIDNPKDFSWPTLQAPVCSTLETLDITLLSEPFLGNLLATTRQLKSLHWSWAYDESFQSMGYTPVVVIDKLLLALEYVKGTLESLSISARNENNGVEYPPLSIHGSWEGLKTFKRLKSLCVPLYVLVGPSTDLSRRLGDYFPSGLEHISITDDLYLQDEFVWQDFEMLELLKSWLDTIQITNPRLRTITVHLTKMDEQWNRPARIMFRKMCAAAGISVRIWKLSRDYY